MSERCLDCRALLRIKIELESERDNLREGLATCMGQRNSYRAALVEALAWYKNSYLDSSDPNHWFGAMLKRHGIDPETLGGEK